MPDINLSFVVEDAFNDDIVQAIDSGIPTSFTYIVKLFRKRNFWTDDHIKTWKFYHTIVYDSLREEYSVELDEKIAVELTRDFQVAKDYLVQGRNIELSSVPELSSGSDYYLKIRAELAPVTLPFHLEYMFFFVKLWDFETDWLTYDFSL
ncbi:MAG: DUF4390 domain-containing protein [Deltaproteobacteria bacterium]|nr:DUF4390 domain-containing protein [Deltaproteobacteria bacterium]